MSSSALAGTDLAHALLANPYAGQDFAGYPAESETTRRTRHAEAIPQMSGHLNDAAHQLDLCATACHYLATGIREDCAGTPDHKQSAQQKKTASTLSTAPPTAAAKAPTTAVAQGARAPRRTL